MGAAKLRLQQQDERVRPRRRRWRCAMAALAVLLACLASSCRLAQLKQDLDQIDTLATVNGQVAVDQPTGAPIRVLVLRLRREHQVKHELVETTYLGSPGKYEFPLLPGSYQVLAFEDQNRNQKLDSGERGDISSPFELTDTDATLGENVHIKEQFSKRFPDTIDRRLVHVGEVASLDDERFSQTAGDQGVWRPLLMMQDYQPGLYLLEAYSPDKTPVLFVHGMSGYGQEFRALVEAVDRKRFQPWLMTYPSGLRLEKLANFVSGAIAEMNTRNPIERMCVVAHSMGGVVTRRALTLHAQKFSPTFVRGFVTIASPLGGIAAAEYGVEFSPEVVPSWRDLVPSDGFIRTLYAEPLSSNIEYRLFAAVTERTADDGVVPIQSQLRHEAQRESKLTRVFVGETHTGILEDPELITYVKRALDSCAKAPAPAKAAATIPAPPAGG